MIDASVSVILVAATASTIIVEGALIFAEKYLNYRYRKGREEGHAQGQQEGAEIERQRWQEWLARKQKAEMSGERFDEPSPAEMDLSER